jgi:hypothetical protein
MFTRTLIAASLLATSGLALPTMASAHGAWQRHHPASTHINHRIARQQVRITHEVREGDMSRAEARDLRGDLHDIRKEERSLAQANGNGHLTPAQARDLNHQLNHTSHDIGH